MTSAATLECLMLYAGADRDWAAQLISRLLPHGVHAQPCPISSDPGWPATFERRLIKAGAVLVVGNGPLGVSGIGNPHLTPARLLRDAGRQPVIDVVAPGRAVADHEAELPRSFADADFAPRLDQLVAMLRSAPSRRPLVMVLAQTDQHFQAARQTLGGAGAATVTYRGRLLCRCPVGPAGAAMIVVRSRADGHLPAELLRPDIVVVQGDAEPPGPPAGPGAVVVGAPGWSRFGAEPAAEDFAKVVRGLDRGGLIRHQAVELGAPSSGEHRSDALLVPLAEASVLRDLPIPTAVAVSAGATPDETAAAVRDLAGALARTVERQVKSIVRLLGFGDRPTGEDSLSRMPIVKVLARVLTDESVADGDASGPTVVTLEGPWGSGKSSMLCMLEKLLAERSPAGRTGQVADGRPLRVRAAARHLGRPLPAGSPAPEITGGDKWRPLVVRFNPWSHHLGEEVWAGLSIAVRTAAEKQLCPDDNRREQYWFWRNIRHVDRRRLAIELRRRIVSPAFKLSLFALAVPILAQVVGRDISVKVPRLGHTLSPPWILLIVGLFLLMVAIVHTTWRYLRGYASSYLPPDLFHAPVLTGALLTGPSADTALLDPLYRARTGQLAQWQQSLREVVHDLEAAKLRLIIFIDDLDRCSPKRTAAVFEAMNDLMSDDYGRTRFVMAVDPTVLAAHLRQSFADTGLADTGDDPDIGRAFLRKLVQLPIIVPAIGAPARRELLGKLLGASTATSGKAEAAATPEEVERDPVFGELFLGRLEDRPASTVREVKRLLTVWQFYLRTLDQQDDDAKRDKPSGFEYVQRARAVFILAEIITRWPSLQSKLHRRTGDGRVLTRLARVAATEPHRWDECWRELKLPTQDSGPAMSAGLRELLGKHPGTDVAAVAERLL